MSLKTWSHGICVAVAFGMLVGCGGGSSSTASTGGLSSGSSGGTSGDTSGGSGNTTGNNSQPPIQGIAMPESVSVVTATNAN
jgi:hypothetical protein